MLFFYYNFLIFSFSDCQGNFSEKKVRERTRLKNLKKRRNRKNERAKKKSKENLNKERTKRGGK